MDASARPPVVIAYDGSAQARHALQEAAGLLCPRRAVVVTVWEPALAMLGIPVSAPIPGGEIPPPDPETVFELERKVEEHATAVAEDGAKLARSLGFDAEPLPVADERNVAETLARIADEQGAQAIVVGSRGLTGLKGSLMGSTSQGVLSRTRLPVIVVRDPHEEDDH